MMPGAAAQAGGETRQLTVSKDAVLTNGKSSRYTVETRPAIERRHARRTCRRGKERVLHGPLIRTGRRPTAVCGQPRWPTEIWHGSRRSSAQPRPTTWWSSSRALRPSRRHGRSSFYGSTSLLRDIEDGRQAIGRACGSQGDETASSFQKIYLRAPSADAGFASATVRFTEDLCRTRGLSAAVPTVQQVTQRPRHPRLPRQRASRPSTPWETDIAQRLRQGGRLIMEKRVNGKRKAHGPTAVQPLRLNRAPGPLQPGNA